MGALSKQAKLYVGTEAVYGLAMGIYGFVLNLFFLDAGLTSAQIGLLTSMGIIIKGASALPLSFITRRLGRRNMYAGGILLIGVSIPFYSFGNSFSAFVLPAIIIALGMIMVEISEVQVMYQSCKSDSERVVVYSLAFAVFALCSSLGVFLAGQASRLYEGGFWQYRGVLLLAGIITIGVSLARWRYLYSDRQAQEQTQAVPTVQLPLRQLLNRPFFILFFMTVLQGAIASMISPYNSLILKFYTNYNDSQLSMVLTCSLLSSFLFAVYTPRLQRNPYNKRVYIAAYLLNFLFCLLLGQRLAIPLFLLLFVLNSGCEIMCKNMIDSVAYLILCDGQRDLFSGVRSLSRGIAGSAASLWTAYAISAGRLNLIFLVTAALIGLAMLLFVTLISPILTHHAKENTHVSLN